MGTEIKEYSARYIRTRCYEVSKSTVEPGLLLECSDICVQVVDDLSSEIVDSDNMSWTLFVRLGDPESPTIKRDRSGHKGPFMVIEDHGTFSAKMAIIRGGEEGVCVRALEPYSYSGHPVVMSFLLSFLAVNGQHSVGRRVAHFVTVGESFLIAPTFSGCQGDLVIGSPAERAGHVLQLFDLIRSDSRVIGLADLVLSAQVSSSDHVRFVSWFSSIEVLVSALHERGCGLGLWQPKQDDGRAKGLAQKYEDVRDDDCPAVAVFRELYSERNRVYHAAKPLSEDAPSRAWEVLRALMGLSAKSQGES